MSHTQTTTACRQENSITPKNLTKAGTEIYLKKVSKKIGTKSKNVTLKKVRTVLLVDDIIVGYPILGKSRNPEGEFRKIPLPLTSEVKSIMENPEKPGGLLIETKKGFYAAY